VLIVNRQEAAKLTGHLFSKKEEVIKDLGKLGVKKVVMTEGRKGAVLIENKKKLSLKAFKVKTVEETGAGDGFGCGVVGGLIKGMDTKKALKTGLANGASVVKHFGPKKGLLFEPELDKWLKK